MKATAAIRSDSMPVRLARMVSLVLHPFLVSPTTIVLLLWLDGGDLWMALRWAALCTALVVVPALVHLRRKLQRREYSDADVSRREQRLGFYLFGIACMVACSAALRWLAAPPVLQAGVAAALLATLIASAANHFWTKVSIHAGAMAGLTAAVAHYSPGSGLVAAAATALVIWARLVLRQHTLAQALAGSAIAALSVLVLFTFWGC